MDAGPALPLSGTRGISRERAELLLHLVAVILFPLVLVLVNNSWALLWPLGWIDPYLYTGYFLDLRHHIEHYGPTYYAARLPWLLLGNAVFSVFEPVTASYVLRFILIYAAAFSMFVTIRLLFASNLAATLTALLLVGHSRFLGAVGWDYVDGFGVTMALVALAALTVAARTPYRAAGFLVAGVAAVMLVSANTFGASLLPVLGLWYLMIADRRRPRDLALAMMLTASGSAVSLLGLCVANWYLGGNFWYFESQVNVSIELAPVTGNWGAPRLRWLSRPHLGLPIAVAAASLVTLGVVGLQYARTRTLAEGQRILGAAAVQMLFVVGGFLVAQYRVIPALQWTYYATFLIPSTFLVMGATIGYATRQMEGRWQGSLILVAAALLLIPFAYQDGTLLYTCSGTCNLLGSTALFVAAAGVAFVALVHLKSKAVLIVMLAVFSVLNVRMADLQVAPVPRQPEMHDRARAVFDARDVVAALNRDGSLLFWYDAREPYGGIYRAVASMHLLNYRLLGEVYPRISPRQSVVLADRIRPGTTVALFSEGEPDLAPGLESLSNLQLDARVIERTTVRQGEVSFQVTFLRLDESGD